jgi:hypothetical protein
VARLNRTAIAAIVALGALVAIGPLATPALADQVDAETGARAAYDRGAEAYEAKDFARAAALLAQADTLSPNPVALNLAVAAAIQTDDPVLMMNLALRVETRAADGSLADLGREARKRSERRVGIVRIVCASRNACRAQLNESDAHDGDRVAVQPGPFQVAFRDAGPVAAPRPPRLVRVTVSAGATVDAVEPSVALAASAPASSRHSATATTAAPSPDRDQQSGLSPMFFWSGVALTAVLGGFSIAAGVDAQRQHDAFMASSPRTVEDRERGRDAETRTNVLLVSTAASALVTSVVGALFTRWSAASPRSAPAAPVTDGR